MIHNSANPGIIQGFGEPTLDLTHDDFLALFRPEPGQHGNSPQAILPVGLVGKTKIGEPRDVATLRAENGDRVVSYFAQNTYNGPRAAVVTAVKTSELSELDFDGMILHVSPDLPGILLETTHPGTLRTVMELAATNFMRQPSATTHEAILAYSRSLGLSVTELPAPEAAPV